MYTGTCAVPWTRLAPKSSVGDTKLSAPEVPSVRSVSVRRCSGAPAARSPCASPEAAPPRYLAGSGRSSPTSSAPSPSPAPSIFFSSPASAAAAAPPAPPPPKWPRAECSASSRSVTDLPASAACMSSSEFVSEPVTKKTSIGMCTLTLPVAFGEKVIFTSSVLLPSMSPKSGSMSTSPAYFFGTRHSKRSGRRDTLRSVQSRELVTPRQVGLMQKMPPSGRSRRGRPPWPTSVKSIVPTEGEWLSTSGSVML